jgi:hypothetical protein
MICECWYHPDDRYNVGITFTTQENAIELVKNGMIEPGEIAIYSVKADTWAEAMTIHHEIQGYEPYVPF